MIRSLLDLAPVRTFLSRRLLISVPGVEPRVALTFDDGPHPVHTPRLLDLLRARGVRGTFFLVGERARAHPGIARRLVDEGHEVGNHGLAHRPLPLLTPAALAREVEGGGLAIEGASGKRPRFFRPPLGWWTDGALRRVREMGYEPALGDVYPRDVARPSAGTIVEHVTSRVGPGSIVILHDGGRTRGVDRTRSLEAAARVVDVLSGRGYRFETLSELAARPGRAAP
jgi:peptidoglycan/xylan/chitin deacetylase (PgdA/CDA1 family)